MSNSLIWISTVAGAAAAIFGVCFMAVKALKWVWSLLFKTKDMLDEWFGQAERPGHERVPGVAERLQAIEKELRPNGGASLRDAIGRIENAVSVVSEKVSTLDTRVADVEAARQNPATS